jgi:hypothetical protein
VYKVTEKAGRFCSRDCYRKWKAVESERFKHALTAGEFLAALDVA